MFFFFHGKIDYFRNKVYIQDKKNIVSHIIFVVNWFSEHFGMNSVFLLKSHI